MISVSRPPNAVVRPNLVSETKKTAKDDARAIRRCEILKDRVEGKLVMRELAAKYGVSVGTVHNDIRTAIEAELEGVKEVVATAREIEERRLDHLLAKLMGQYENETDPNVTAKLATAALKVSEQRAKLLGLYAAEKIEAKVTGVASPAEAARLVREAFGEHASQKPNDSSARVPEAT